MDMCADSRKSGDFQQKRGSCTGPPQNMPAWFKCPPRIQERSYPVPTGVDIVPISVGGRNGSGGSSKKKFACGKCGEGGSENNNQAPPKPKASADCPMMKARCPGGEKKEESGGGFFDKIKAFFGKPADDPKLVELCKKLQISDEQVRHHRDVFQTQLTVRKDGYFSPQIFPKVDCQAKKPECDCDRTPPPQVCTCEDEDDEECEEDLFEEEDDEEICEDDEEYEDNITEMEGCDCTCDCGDEDAALGNVGEKAGGGESGKGESKEEEECVEDAEGECIIEESAECMDPACNFFLEEPEDRVTKKKKKCDDFSKVGVTPEDDSKSKCAAMNNFIIRVQSPFDECTTTNETCEQILERLTKRRTNYPEPKIPEKKEEAKVEKAEVELVVKQILVEAPTLECPKGKKKVCRPAKKAEEVKPEATPPSKEEIVEPPPPPKADCVESPPPPPKEYCVELPPPPPKEDCTELPPPPPPKPEESQEPSSPPEPPRDNSRFGVRKDEPIPCDNLLPRGICPQPEGVPCPPEGFQGRPPQPECELDRPLQNDCEVLSEDELLQKPIKDIYCGCPKEDMDSTCGADPSLCVWNPPPPPPCASCGALQRGDNADCYMCTITRRMRSGKPEVCTGQPIFRIIKDEPKPKDDLCAPPEWLKDGSIKYKGGMCIDGAQEFLWNASKKIPTELQGNYFARFLGECGEEERMKAMFGTVPAGEEGCRPPGLPEEPLPAYRGGFTLQNARQYLWHEEPEKDK